MTVLIFDGGIGRGVSVFDAVVVDTPFGYYNERIYRCPLAAVHWQGHLAATTRGLPTRDEHGDFHCVQCKARIYADTARKLPFTLGLVIREEWL